MFQSYDPTSAVGSLAPKLELKYNAKYWRDAPLDPFEVSLAGKQVSSRSAFGILEPSAGRSEIHHNGKVLRSTHVKKWRTGEDIPVHVQPKNAPQLQMYLHSKLLRHLERNTWQELNLLGGLECATGYKGGQIAWGMSVLRKSEGKMFSTLDTMLAKFTRLMIYASENDE